MVLVDVAQRCADQSSRLTLPTYTASCRSMRRAVTLSAELVRREVYGRSRASRCPCDIGCKVRPSGVLAAKGVPGSLVGNIRCRSLSPLSLRRPSPPRAGLARSRQPHRARCSVALRSPNSTSDAMSSISTVWGSRRGAIVADRVDLLVRSLDRIVSQTVGFWDGTPRPACRLALTMPTARAEACATLSGQQGHGLIRGRCLGSRPRTWRAGAQ